MFFTSHLKYLKTVIQLKIQITFLLSANNKHKSSIAGSLTFVSVFPPVVITILKTTHYWLVTD